MSDTPRTDKCAFELSDCPWYAGQFVPAGVCRYLERRAAALEAENAKLREENELRDEAMHRLRDWTRAYPLSVFPEPDFERVHEVLKVAGITLDSVSASNMRHVLKGVESILSETWESIRSLKSPSSGGEK